VLVSAVDALIGLLVNIAILLVAALWLRFNPNPVVHTRSQPLPLDAEDGVEESGDTLDDRFIANVDVDVSHSDVLTSMRGDSDVLSTTSSTSRHAAPRRGSSSLELDLSLSTLHSDHHHTSSHPSRTAHSGPSHVGSDHRHDHS
jgi:hypothetical protein